MTRVSLDGSGPVCNTMASDNYANCCMAHCGGRDIWTLTSNPDLTQYCSQTREGFWIGKRGQPGPKCKCSNQLPTENRPKLDMCLWSFHIECTHKLSHVIWVINIIQILVFIIICHWNQGTFTTYQGHWWCRSWSEAAAGCWVALVVLLHGNTAGIPGQPQSPRKFASEPQWRCS